MMQPGIEPRSPGPLAITLPACPNYKVFALNILTVTSSMEIFAVFFERKGQRRRERERERERESQLMVRKNRIK